MFPIVNPPQKKSFDPTQQPFSANRHRAAQICRQFNLLSPLAVQERKKLLSTLVHGDLPIFIESDFYCEYGDNIHIGAETFINHNVTINDSAPIVIGKNVLIGPNCFLNTVLHQAANKVTCAAIKIGDHVWIGANVTICGGVEIGDHAIIGAGCIIKESVGAGEVVKGI
ncbi:DapH/DapD/GlmU-related protein [Alteromonas ponticola]|uniref:DapH/DapD/GlmU-related protein n=1 Tax=Alteromonas aquimaris TaxID=2998417 RepID=A0ABT3PAV6_9ALTE|nr:DapH/DapD/GlmU-related protein [Alteromonas aquimaris]MCW8109835.1 DapH/DapD/GlmU-related protein [Alteromonas aquimaris]